MDMLASWQGLRENIYYLLINGRILKLHDPSLNIVPDGRITNLNMFIPIMENWILSELDTTLIITVDHGRSQPLTEKDHQHLVNPNGLTTGLTSCHVFVDFVP